MITLKLHQWWMIEFISVVGCITWFRGELNTMVVWTPSSPMESSWFLVRQLFVEYAAKAVLGPPIMYCTMNVIIYAFPYLSVQCADTHSLHALPCKCILPKFMVVLYQFNRCSPLTVTSNEATELLGPKSLEFLSVKIL